MSFRLVPKSVTLHDLERRNGVTLRYFSVFGSFRGALCKSSRSLSHLLMSSCYHWNQFKVIPLSCTLRTRNRPKFSATSDDGCRHRMAQKPNISHPLSYPGSDEMTIDY